MPRRSLAIVLLTAIALMALGPMAAAQGAGVPTLVDIRAAHHPGFDRVVFEFHGGLPALHSSWSTRPPTLDPSGLPSGVQGNAYLTLAFQGATGTAQQAPYGSTYGASRRAFDLPNVAHVVTIGDYEAVLAITIGVMVRPSPSRFHVYALAHPSRWVVDLGTDFARRSVTVWFLDTTAPVGPSPMRSVTRSVPVSAIGRSTLERLFAGPTMDERASGLRLVTSRAVDVTGPTVSSLGVARVRLVGGCRWSSSTPITVADELKRTVRALPGVDWVKVAGPDGTTEHPTGLRDSIPACLEPIP